MLEIEKWAREKNERAAAKQKQKQDTAGGARATEGGGVGAGGVGGGGGVQRTATDGWFPRAKPEPLAFFSFS
jgi:hypothetical protein